MQDDLLSSGEVANQLGVHLATVIRWAEAGKLPTAKQVGRIRLFRLADVEAIRLERLAEKRAEVARLEAS